MFPFDGQLNGDPVYDGYADTEPDYIPCPTKYPFNLPECGLSKTTRNSILSEKVMPDNLTDNVPNEQVDPNVVEEQPTSLLSSIRETKHSAPPRVVLHGPEKVGKSTFFSQSPNPIFIQTEDGLTGVNAQAFPLATSFQMVLDQLSALCTDPHDFSTVIIDSADWLERLIHAHVCEAEGVSNIEKAQGGYGKGYLEALGHWRTVLRALDYLNKDMGMIVGIICHSRIVSINDPLNELYDSYQMKLHSPKSGNGSSELLREWADILCFADTQKFTRKIQVGQDKKNTVGRATGTDKRILYTRPSPAYAAGNRYGLPEELPLEWNALQEALSQSN